MATLMEKLEDNKRNSANDEGSMMAKKGSDIGALAAQVNKDAAASAGAAPAENKAEGKPVEDKAADAAASEFKVLSGVPIPDGRPARESKYPWDSLEVGQSFFVPGAKTDTFNTLTSTRNKKGEKKFISRKWTGENGVLGVMVWRKS